jgi:hypothetical protein
MTAFLLSGLRHHAVARAATTVQLDLRIVIRLIDGLALRV